MLLSTNRGEKVYFVIICNNNVIWALNFTRFFLRLNIIIIIIMIVIAKQINILRGLCTRMDIPMCKNTVKFFTTVAYGGLNSKKKMPELLVFLIFGTKNEYFSIDRLFGLALSQSEIVNFFFFERNNDSYPSKRRIWMSDSEVFFFTLDISLKMINLWQCKPFHHWITHPEWPLGLSLTQFMWGCPYLEYRRLLFCIYTIDITMIIFI